MRKIKKYLLSGLLLSIWLGSASVVSAHTLWINVSDYLPEDYPGYRARTKIYFGYGHHYPVDDFLSVKVLFEEKPARFWPVYATYNGFSTRDDFAYATITNSEGIARIRILHHGPWLIKTTNKLPVPDDLKEKCDNLHYTATLTFEVP